MPFCHARPGEASNQPTVAINGPAEETRNYHPAVVLLGDGNEMVGAS
jgi:hypothetical protein